MSVADEGGGSGRVVGARVLRPRPARHGGARRRARRPFPRSGRITVAPRSAGGRHRRRTGHRSRACPSERPPAHRRSWSAVAWRSRPSPSCLPATLAYDPWAWLVWGREIGHLDLDTTGGPSWKPLPVVITTPLAVLGDLAPTLWLVVARTGRAARARRRVPARAPPRRAGGRVARGRLPRAHPRRRVPVPAPRARGPLGPVDRRPRALGRRPPPRRPPPTGAGPRDPARLGSPRGLALPAGVRRLAGPRRPGHAVARRSPRSCRCRSCGSAATGGVPVAPPRRRCRPGRTATSQAAWASPSSTGPRSSWRPSGSCPWLGGGLALARRDRHRARPSSGWPSRGWDSSWA